MNFTLAFALTGFLALLVECNALAQTVPPQAGAQANPVAHAKVYVSVPQPSSAVSAGSDAGSWRAQLEKSGILSQSGPYRVGLPIAEFGDGGPKLSFTYIPRMKDGVGSRVLMFMLRTSID